MIKMTKKKTRTKTTKIKVVDIDGITTILNSIDEAANAFECTKQTIYVALKRGRIRGCKISKIN